MPMFPGATSLWKGLKQAVTRRRRQRASSRPTAASRQKPDAAVVVFGEKPYAEFQGDRATLRSMPS